MLTEERFAKILSILESMGSVTVQQLMTELDASESTIRRDLNALDANGQLTKVHGKSSLCQTLRMTDCICHKHRLTACDVLDHQLCCRSGIQINKIT